MTNWLSIVFVAAAAGCGPAPKPEAGPSVEPETTAPVAIDEAWLASFELADNIDSVAVAADQGWVIATTKGTHQLLVLDAAGGELVRRVAGPGSEIGQLQRPNGIAVRDGMVLVVERDNHRVQVFSLPDLEPIGIVGAEELERPYGIAATSNGDVVTIWVTDNFELPPGDPSGNPRLAERVKVFEITRDGRALESAHVASFGEVEGEGALWKVETIAVDPVNDVLLVVDETESRMGMRIYTPAGEFTGRIVGGDVFSAEPEGIGLWTDGDAGYWVATDQHAALSVYHLFDRTTFAHVGAFAGAVTANTDGIAVVGRPVGPFPDGAVFAVHDDQGVSAFDWRTVGAAMD